MEGGDGESDLSHLRAKVEEGEMILRFPAWTTDKHWYPSPRWEAQENCRFGEKYGTVSPHLYHQ